MRLNNIFSLLLVLCITFSVSSCKFGDTNVDPDNPSDANAGVLLTSVQTHMAYALGGEGQRYGSIFIQQYTGTANQHLNYSAYEFFPNDVTNLWQSLYEDSFPDINTIITKAQESGAKDYEGIGKIMKALWLGNTTDLFGDIPYSEANKGAANLNPTFDSQQTLYTEIQTLLDAGIADLGSVTSASVTGDLVYAGDVAKWIKLARLLKARYYLRTSKVDANAAANALAALNAGTMTANADDYDFAFESGQGNPIAQFEAQRAGDIAMGAYFVNMLVASSDPRTSFITNGTTNLADPLVGSSSYAGAASTGTYFAAGATPITLGSYAEAKLIEAEAKLRTGDDAGALTALQEAATQSIAKITGGTGSATAYTTALATAWAGAADQNAKINLIITEKYVALHGSPEPYHEYRRTGYPSTIAAFSAIDGQATSNGGAIPRRYPYSQNEVDYNSNTPSVALTARMWWDAQ